MMGRREDPAGLGAQVTGSLIDAGFLSVSLVASRTYAEMFGDGVATANADGQIISITSDRGDMSAELGGGPPGTGLRDFRVLWRAFSGTEPSMELNELARQIYRYVKEAPSGS